MPRHSKATAGIKLWDATPVVAAYDFRNGVVKFFKVARVEFSDFGKTGFGNFLFRLAKHNVKRRVFAVERKMKRQETFVGRIQQLGENRLGQFSYGHTIADKCPIRIDAGNGDINHFLFDDLEPFFEQRDIHEKTLISRFLLLSEAQSESCLRHGQSG